MKKCLAFLVAFLLSVAAFADGWYVCMGSFKNLDKAKERARVLSVEGFDVFVSEVERTGNEKLYRVLFSESFAQKSGAVSKRNEFLSKSSVKRLGLSDLWCCESDGRRVGGNAPLDRQVVVRNRPPEGNADEQMPPSRPAPVSQTVVVSVNGEEKQRFEINSDDRLIKVNVNIDEPERSADSKSLSVGDGQSATELKTLEENGEALLQKSLDSSVLPASSSAEKTASEPLPATPFETESSSATAPSDAAASSETSASADTSEPTEDANPAVAAESSSEDTNSSSDVPPIEDVEVKTVENSDSEISSVEDAK
ncbi:MAG: SPOR domain-containing protein [Treponema sp.]|nr:SPOR domain-containing protein [Treponema sp.]